MVGFDVDASCVGAIPDTAQSLLPRRRVFLRERPDWKGGQFVADAAALCQRRPFCPQEPNCLPLGRGGGGESQASQIPLVAESTFREVDFRRPPSPVGVWGRSRSGSRSRSRSRERGAGRRCRSPGVVKWKASAQHPPFRPLQNPLHGPLSPPPPSHVLPSSTRSSRLAPPPFRSSPWGSSCLRSMHPSPSLETPPGVSPISAISPISAVSPTTTIMPISPTATFDFPSPTYAVYSPCDSSLRTRSLSPALYRGRPSDPCDAEGRPRRTQSPSHTGIVWPPLNPSQVAQADEGGAMRAAIAELEERAARGSLLESRSRRSSSQRRSWSLSRRTKHSPSPSNVQRRDRSSPNEAPRQRSLPLALPALEREPPGGSSTERKKLVASHQIRGGGRTNGADAATFRREAQKTAGSAPRESFTQTATEGQRRQRASDAPRREAVARESEDEAAKARSDRSPPSPPYKEGRSLPTSPPLTQNAQRCRDGDGCQSASQKTGNGGQRSGTGAQSAGTDSGSRKSDEGSQRAETDSGSRKLDEGSQRPVTDSGSRKSERGCQRAETDSASRKSERGPQRPETDSGSRKSERGPQRAETDSGSRKAERGSQRPITDSGSRKSERGPQRPETDSGSRKFERGSQRAVTDSGSRKSEGGYQRAETDSGSRKSEGGYQRPEMDSGSRKLDEGSQRAVTDSGSRKSDEGCQRAETDSGSRKSERGCQRAETDSRSRKAERGCQRAEKDFGSRKSDEGCQRPVIDSGPRKSEGGYQRAETDSGFPRAGGGSKTDEGGSQGSTRGVASPQNASREGASAERTQSRASEERVASFLASEKPASHSVDGPGNSGLGKRRRDADASAATHPTCHPPNGSASSQFAVSQEADLTWTSNSKARQTQTREGEIPGASSGDMQRRSSDLCGVGQSGARSRSRSRDSNLTAVEPSAGGTRELHVFLIVEFNPRGSSTEAEGQAGNVSAAESGIPVALPVAYAECQEKIQVFLGNLFEVPVDSIYGVRRADGYLRPIHWQSFAEGELHWICVRLQPTRTLPVPHGVLQERARLLASSSGISRSCLVDSPVEGARGPDGLCTDGSAAVHDASVQNVSPTPAGVSAAAPWKSGSLPVGRDDLETPSSPAAEPSARADSPSSSTAETCVVSASSAAAPEDPPEAADVSPDLAAPALEAADSLPRQRAFVADVSPDLAAPALEAADSLSRQRAFVDDVASASPPLASEATRGGGEAVVFPPGVATVAGAVPSFPAAKSAPAASGSLALPLSMARVASGREAEEGCVAEAESPAESDGSVSDAGGFLRRSTTSVSFPCDASARSSAAVALSQRRRGPAKLHRVLARLAEALHLQYNKQRDAQAALDLGRENRETDATAPAAAEGSSVSGVSVHPSQQVRQRSCRLDRCRELGSQLQRNSGLSLLGQWLCVLRGGCEGVAIRDQRSSLPQIRSEQATQHKAHCTNALERGSGESANAWIANALACRFFIKFEDASLLREALVLQEVVSKAFMAAALQHQHRLLARDTAAVYVRRLLVDCPCASRGGRRVGARREDYGETAMAKELFQRLAAKLPVSLDELADALENEGGSEATAPSTSQPSLSAALRSARRSLSVCLDSYVAWLERLPVLRRQFEALDEKEEAQQRATGTAGFDASQPAERLWMRVFVLDTGGGPPFFDFDALLQSVRSARRGKEDKDVAEPKASRLHSAAERARPPVGHADFEAALVRDFFWRAMDGLARTLQAFADVAVEARDSESSPAGNAERGSRLQGGRGERNARDAFKRHCFFARMHEKFRSFKSDLRFHRRHLLDTAEREEQEAVVGGSLRRRVFLLSIPLSANPVAAETLSVGVLKKLEAALEELGGRRCRRVWLAVDNPAGVAAAVVGCTALASAASSCYKTIAAAQAQRAATQAAATTAVPSTATPCQEASGAVRVERPSSGEGSALGPSPPACSRPSLGPLFSLVAADFPAGTGEQLALKAAQLWRLLEGVAISAFFFAQMQTPGGGGGSRQAAPARDLDFDEALLLLECLATFQKSPLPPCLSIAFWRSCGGRCSAKKRREAPAALPFGAVSDGALFQDASSRRAVHEKFKAAMETLQGNGASTRLFSGASRTLQVLYTLRGAEDPVPLLCTPPSNTLSAGAAEERGVALSLPEAFRLVAYSATAGPSRRGAGLGLAAPLPATRSSAFALAVEAWTADLPWQRLSSCAFAAAASTAVAFKRDLVSPRDKGEDAVLAAAFLFAKAAAAKAQRRRGEGRGGATGEERSAALKLLAATGLREKMAESVEKSGSCDALAVVAEKVWEQRKVALRWASLGLGASKAASEELERLKRSLEEALQELPEALHRALVHTSAPAIRTAAGAAVDLLRPTPWLSLCVLAEKLLRCQALGGIESVVSCTDTEAGPVETFGVPSADADLTGTVLFPQSFFGGFALDSAQLVSRTPLHTLSGKLPDGRVLTVELVEANVFNVLTYDDANALLETQRKRHPSAQQGFFWLYRKQLCQGKAAPRKKNSREGNEPLPIPVLLVVHPLNKCLMERETENCAFHGSSDVGSRLLMVLVSAYSGLQRGCVLLASDAEDAKIRGVLREPVGNLAEFKRRWSLHVHELKVRSIQLLNVEVAEQRRLHGIEGLAARSCAELPRILWEAAARKRPSAEGVPAEATPWIAPSKRWLLSARATCPIEKPGVSGAAAEDGVFQTEKGCGLFGFVESSVTALVAASCFGVLCALQFPPVVAAVDAFASTRSCCWMNAAPREEQTSDAAAASAGVRCLHCAVPSLTSLSGEAASGCVSLAGPLGLLRCLVDAAVSGERLSPTFAAAMREVLSFRAEGDLRPVLLSLYRNGDDFDCRTPGGKGLCLGWEVAPEFVPLLKRACQGPFRAENAILCSLPAAATVDSAAALDASREGSGALSVEASEAFLEKVFAALEATMVDLESRCKAGQSEWLFKFSRAKLTGYTTWLAANSGEGGGAFPLAIVLSHLLCRIDLGAASACETQVAREFSPSGEGLSRLVLCVLLLEKRSRHKRRLQVRRDCSCKFQLRSSYRAGRLEGRLVPFCPCCLHATARLLALPESREADAENTSSGEKPSSLKVVASPIPTERDANPPRALEASSMDVDAPSPAGEADARTAVRRSRVEEAEGALGQKRGTGEAGEGREAAARKRPLAVVAAEAGGEGRPPSPDEAVAASGICEAETPSEQRPQPSKRLRLAAENSPAEGAAAPVDEARAAVAPKLTEEECRPSPPAQENPRQEEGSRNASREMQDAQGAVKREREQVGETQLVTNHSGAPSSKALAAASDLAGRDAVPASPASLNDTPKVCSRKQVAAAEAQSGACGLLPVFKTEGLGVPSARECREALAGPGEGILQQETFAPHKVEAPPEAAEGGVALKKEEVASRGRGRKEVSGRRSAQPFSGGELAEVIEVSDASSENGSSSSTGNRKAAPVSSSPAGGPPSSSSSATSSSSSSSSAAASASSPPSSSSYSYSGSSSSSSSASPPSASAAGSKKGPPASCPSSSPSNVIQIDSDSDEAPRAETDRRNARRGRGSSSSAKPKTQQQRSGTRPARGRRGGARGKGDRLTCQGPQASAACTGCTDTAQQQTQTLREGVSQEVESAPDAGREDLFGPADEAEGGSRKAAAGDSREPPDTERSSSLERVRRMVKEKLRNEEENTNSGRGKKTMADIRTSLARNRML